MFTEIIFLTICTLAIQFLLVATSETNVFLYKHHFSETGLRFVALSNPALPCALQEVLSVPQFSVFTHHFDHQNVSTRLLYLKMNYNPQEL